MLYKNIGVRGSVKLSALCDSVVKPSVRSFFTTESQSALSYTEEI